MRSSVLFTSALAVGAMAGPIEKRKLVTETKLFMETITVYVTAGQPIPSPSPSPEPAEIQAAGYAPVPVPEPSSSCSSSESPAYVAASSSVAIYTPAPAPTTTVQPSTSSDPTTSAAPTSAAPTSVAPTTSAAPAPTSSTAAPQASAPSYGVNHVSGPSQDTLSSGPDYQDAVLWHHNRARANHGADNLQWSSECESAARTAAEFCDFEHHTVDGQGQNLFTNSGDAYNVTAGITESWYKGEADIYSWWGQEPPHAVNDIASLDMETFEKYGHLTQMLWKSTTHVGCVTIDCGSKMTVGGSQSNMNKYTVCNYSPPGNYVSDFAKNVAAPAGSYAGYKWSD